jgi:hypothetical protein
MFPVRCELNSYINLLRNSVFKGLKDTRDLGARGLSDCVEGSWRD